MKQWWWYVAEGGSCGFCYWLVTFPEKALVTHSSPLAWKIPRTEEPGGLQSMGSLRVGHDWATSLSLFTFMHWEGNGNPLQGSCLENPRDRGAWWAAVYGVAQSRTRLKWLSSSSSSSDFSYSNREVADWYWFPQYFWKCYRTMLPQMLGKPNLVPSLCFRIENYFTFRS